MSDDLVKQWDEYIESMGCVMGEVEHMAQKMRNRIEELEAENKALRKTIEDAGFYYDPEIDCATKGEWAARAKAAEAKLKEAEKNAMAEALIAIQQHTTDAWVKGLRLPHLLRMVGLLRGDIR